MRTTSPWARVTANRGNHIKKTSWLLREGNAEYQAPREVVQRNLATMNTDVVAGAVVTPFGPWGGTYSSEPLNGKSCLHTHMNQIPATPPRDRVGVEVRTEVEVAPP